MAAAFDFQLLVVLLLLIIHSFTFFIAILLLLLLHHQELFLLLFGQLALLGNEFLAISVTLIAVFLGVAFLDILQFREALTVLILAIELGIEQLRQLLLGHVERVRVLLIFLLEVGDKQLSFLIIELINIELHLVFIIFIFAFPLRVSLIVLAIDLLILSNAVLVHLVSIIVLIGLLLVELLLLLKVLVSLLVLRRVIIHLVIINRLSGPVLRRLIAALLGAFPGGMLEMVLGGAGTLRAALLLRIVAIIFLSTGILIVALTSLVKVDILILDELAQLLDLLTIQLHAHLVCRCDQVGMDLHVHVVFSLFVLIVVLVIVYVIAMAMPVVLRLSIALIHARILV